LRTRHQNVEAPLHPQPRMLPPRPRSRQTLNPGLLGRISRPSVARAAWSFVGSGKVCDHAARASGGLLLSRKSRTASCYPWSARSRHCAQPVAVPGGRSGTIADPALPVGLVVLEANPNSGVLPDVEPKNLVRTFFWPSATRRCGWPEKKGPARGPSGLMMTVDARTGTWRRPGRSGGSREGCSDRSHRQSS